MKIFFFDIIKNIAAAKNRKSKTKKNFTTNGILITRTNLLNSLKKKNNFGIIY